MIYILGVVCCSVGAVVTASTCFVLVLWVVSRIARLRRRVDASSLDPGHRHSLSTYDTPPHTHSPVYTRHLR